MRITGPDSAYRAIAAVFGGAGRRALVLLGLDEQRRVQQLVVVDGTDRCDDVERLLGFIGLAPDQFGRTIVLGIHRPGGSTEPTMTDLEDFEVWREITEMEGVVLADVLLIDGNEWRSLSEAMG